MAEGRGGAFVAGALVVYLVALFGCEVAEAATYTVGGASGWTFNIASWPIGKNFKAGDIIVFNYIPAAHNVVSVDRRAYNSCTTPKGAKVYQSGRDRIRLVRGQNCFICNFPGHCQSGMKIAINAM